MVRDVEPVADLHPVAVERERPVVEGVRDEERDQLLRMVVRPVRVRAAGDDHVEPVRHVVAARQQLAGGLRRRVRRARPLRIALPREAGLDGPVDLVRGDLEQPRRAGALAGGRSLRLATDGLEQHVDAVHARPQERRGVQDGAVDVGLRGEVDDRVGLRHERPRRGRVGDVAVHEREAPGLLGVGLHLGEVRAVTGVGELVEDRDPHPVATGQDVADKAAADEAGAAGDQEPRGRAGGAHATGRWGGAASSPASSAAAASSAARRSDVTVPASAQCPSKRRVNSPPAAM